MKPALFIDATQDGINRITPGGSRSQHNNGDQGPQARHWKKKLLLLEKSWALAFDSVVG